MERFEDIVAAHLKAIQERDLPAFSAFLDPSRNCILIFPGGQMTQGYENVLNFHKDWFEDPDWRMDCQLLDAFTIGSAGYALLDVVYKDLDQDGNPYELKYYLSLLFAKVEGRWILLRDQNTKKA